jgi:hypothetical protein
VDIYALRRKNITYVKDEESNMNILTIALKSIVSCDMLDLEESFQGTCFGHAFSKALLICYNKGKSLQRFKICVNEIHSRRFVKMHNLANCFWKG